jgi:CheY-like chemotaxis protein/signal transduction histidine kinase/CHASE3 domain sensor protein
MPNDKIAETENFRRILTRNVALPLGLGLVSAALFIFLIVYLLDAMRWVEHTDRVLAKAYATQKVDLNLESGARGFMLGGDERYLEDHEALKASLASELQALASLVADNPPQAHRVRVIQGLQDEWLGVSRTAIERKRADPSYTVSTMGRGKQIKDAVRAQYDQLVASEQQLRAERTSTVNRNAVLTVSGFVVFMISVGGLLAWRGKRDLTALSSTFTDAIEQQRVQAEGLRAQAWLRDGQRQLVESLAGKQQLDVLGHKALEFLSRYTGSVVGAIYVDTGGGKLERVSTWGFASQDDPNGRQFAGRDSIVAEVAANMRQVRLAEVPANYLRVTSALGQGTPQSILVSPIENDGEVNGVIELGFLRPLEDRDAELLHLARGSLGASVEAARYRVRLQDSLEESQQLNEELQVQQEELRTANEELEEQSRALKESQAQLEGQQAELEQTNVQLAEQRDALDEKNEALNLVQLTLEERAGELERASRYKSEFLANMSHELRTPLNSSLILSRLLADNGHGNLTAEQIRFAESIYSAGNDLLNLINDILDISKVEAGKLDVRPEVTGVPALAESLRRTFEPLAANKKLSFELLLAPGLPATFYTDRQRVEQILKNLLSNAIKFTETGAVTLTVSPRSPGAIAFDVKDSGIGIDASAQDIIFEAFRQADGTTSRKYGGTGLGLSISRDLAGLLGGSITVTSAPGEGSTFTLVLPLQYEAGQSAPAAALAPLPAPSSTRPPAPPAPRAARSPGLADDRNADRQPQQRRVLIVEDEPQFASILLDLAHELGYSCLVAHHADEAGELAEQYVPDAMLLDMRLPDGSGLAVLQRIKDNPKTRHIPVHIISAEDVSEAALQMGAIGHAKKPTTREELREVFKRLEDKFSQKVKRVLVVEDDALQRESIARLIGDDDIEITAVGLGVTALELLRTMHFDCMVIDLKLPDMPGNELLKRMSSESIQSFPPVIVYTGRNLTREEEADLMRYSQSIIIKGARSPERLLDEVTLFLHKVETDMSSERQKMLKVARNRDKLFEGRRILLVDDDVRNIFALTSALEYKGASVDIARNGREALDKLAALPDVDLVLMDIMMPEMDGYTATREIRKNPKWKKLPIIAVTAKAMKDDQDRCLAAGANDYLAKPIELERLFSLIRVWMPKMERI